MSEFFLPNKSISFEQLHVVELQYPGRKSHEPQLIDSIYSSWKDIWSETLRDLVGQNKVFSDNFTRQDAIVALMLGAECIGQLSLRKVDMTFSGTKDDSIFSSWNSQVWENVCAQFDKILVCSGLGIKKEYRSVLVEQIPLKLIMCHLAVCYMRESSAQALLATARKDKGVGKSTTMVGSEILGQSVMFGVEVDLIQINKKNIENNPDFMPADQLQYLWLKRFRSGEIESQLYTNKNEAA